MIIVRRLLSMLFPVIALGCTQQAAVTPIPAASPLLSKCPAHAGTRSISGSVVDAGDVPVAFAMVAVLNATCTGTADINGRWVLPGAPAESLMLQASFIGFTRSLVPLPASERDTSGLLVRLLRRSEPDAGAYIPGPVPPEDLKGMLEAVIGFFGPRTEDIGSELDAVAAMTGSPTPSRIGIGPTVVLDSAGTSAWTQIPEDWLVEWLAESRIEGICTGWRDPACREFGLTSFLRLSQLPRRTTLDSAYARVMASVLSVQDCYTAQSMGHFSEEILLVTRTGGSWSAQPGTSGGELQGTLFCDPSWTN